MPMTKERRSDLDVVEFCHDFISESEERKEAERSVHSEVLENYYSEPRQPAARGDGIKVKVADPETFQVIETLVAKTMLTAQSDQGYIHANPVGREDAYAGSLANALLEADFRRPGNSRAMYTAYKDTFLLSQSVIMPYWAYEEIDMPIRSTALDHTGQEVVTESVVPQPVRDGVELLTMDFDDYHLEGDKEEIRLMDFGCRRFTIPRYKAEQLAKDGVWRSRAVKRAIRAGAGTKMYDKEQGEWRIDRTHLNEPFKAYEPMIGFECYGNLPFLPPDGVRRRKIVLLNGELVMNRPMPMQVSRVVPFYEMICNPVLGRFGGVAPGAIARFTQSLTNAVLVALARATVRIANPPIVVRRNAQVDMKAVAKWAGPIKSLRGGEDIMEAKWNPRLQEAFALLSQLKNSMREQTGALGQVQGSSFGEKQLRSSFEAQFLGQAAMDRPEMIARLFEAEYLPNLGRGMFELSQQFVEDSEDLAKRVGSARLRDAAGRMPLLDDIQGQFDLEFVGSKRSRSKQAQMEVLERVMQVAGSVPGAAPMFPWVPAFVSYLQRAEEWELAAMVADPQGAYDFIVNSMTAGQGARGNGNAASAALPPGGLLPNQTAGRALSGQ